MGCFPVKGLFPVGVVPKKGNSIVPYDMELEYLESTGTQYIDTGIKQADDLVIECTFMKTGSTVTWGTYFGCGYDDKSANNILGRHYSTTDTVFNPWFANTTYSERQISIPSATPVTVTLKQNFCNYNNMNYSINSVSGRLKTDHSIYLFSANKDNAPWRSQPCRIYHFSIKRGNGYLIDLWPVRVGSVGCMYDTVSGKIFENNGVNPFVCGQDHVPRYYKWTAFKLLATRGIRACNTSYDVWKNGSYESYCQVSDMAMCNDGVSVVYNPASDVNMYICTAFNGHRYCTTPTGWQNWNSGERVGRLFDWNKNTKFCTVFFTGRDYSLQVDVKDFDTGNTVISHTESITSADAVSHYGASDRFVPIAIVLYWGDGHKIDIETCKKWAVRNANDTNAFPGRQPIEMELVGSENGRTWWRLDAVNSLSLPTTNYEKYYVGSLSPRVGDLWYGLDLKKRDWKNGIEA